MRILGGILLVAAVAGASSDVLRRASDLYQQTDYAGSLHILAEDPAPDAASYLLTGKNYFMSGDYKKAIEFFEKASAGLPSSSECQLWLGRAWGRRAETSSWVTAASYAGRARQHFEKAVALDPRNREAKNDLFSFYLDAPGFLGGGLDKADAAAKSIFAERPAESEFEQSQVDEKRKDYAGAENHLRRAIQFAPTEAGRVIDLARFLAKRGRFQEAETLFGHARKLAPNQAKVAFVEASVEIENHRDIEHARELLESYIHARLTPDDPPRQEAKRLLQRVGGAGE